MLQIATSQRYFLFAGHADMRKGFDSLGGIVTNQMKQSLSGGDVFIFLNRKRTHIKLLQREGDGFAIYYKRLEQGSFEVPKTDATNSSLYITAGQLSLILQGISLQHVKHRKRYQHQLKFC